MPDPVADPGFVVSFHQKFGPVPYYAGRLSSTVDLEMLEAQMAGEEAALRYYSRYNPQQLAAFHEKVEDAWSSGRAKRTRRTPIPALESEAQAVAGRSTKRTKSSLDPALEAEAEALLGRRDALREVTLIEALRPLNLESGVFELVPVLEDSHPSGKSKSAGSPLVATSGIAITAPNKQKKGTEKRKQKAIARVQKAEADLMNARNALGLVWKTPGLCFDCVPPVIIAIDVESYELDHGKITEIGISTLNQDLRHKSLSSLSLQIDDFHTRHFRIVQNAHLRNGRFVEDCAENFEFGDSEWIYQQEAARAISTCFREPYSMPGYYIPFAHEPEEAGGPFPQSVKSPISRLIPDREIVVVGHALSGDLNYLRKLGCNLDNLGNLRGFCDTGTLFRDAIGEANVPSLATACAAFDVIPWHLHNAGNDAAYTLKVFIEFMRRHA